MRICLYTETALPAVGGQELVVDALARQFLALGHQAMVLAPLPRKLPCGDHTLPYPVVRHPRFLSTRHLVGWYRHWLLRLHRRWRFDVLHCQSVYPCGYIAALARSRLTVPVVITSHGGDIREGNVRLAKRGLPERHALAIQSADALVAISRFTADGFRRLCPTAQRIVDIPNGVELEPLSTPATRPDSLDPEIRPGEYILFLGRLHRRKGVDVLLDAIARTPGSDDLVQLVIAGDGGERAALIAQAERLGVGSRVRFVGQVRGATKTYLLQNALALAIPSRDWEAFPLVVLEAYAAGCPAIGTLISGLSDVIQAGQTGLLVPPESPDALAVALTTMLTDSQLAQRLAAQARQIAQGYSYRRIAERHLRLYEECLLERQRLGRVA